MWSMQCLDFHGGKIIIELDLEKLKKYKVKLLLIQMEALSL